MANSFANIMDKILARGLLALRKETVMPRLVNSSYDTEAKEFGDTIDVPVPVKQTATAVTPSNTPPTPASKTPNKVRVALDQWFSTDFHLTDKQLKEIDRNKHFMPMQISEAAKVLAEQVNTNIFSHFNEIGPVVGTTGTALFSSDAELKTTISALVKAMRNHEVPNRDRRLVLDPTTEADVIVRDAFIKANEAGTDETIRDASVGHKFGFDWIPDQQAGQAFTPGTGASYQTDAAFGLDAQTITVDTGTGTILVGDTVTFAGHTVPTEYVVTSALSGGSIGISPGLKETVADNEAVTVKNASAGASTHILAFHRDCFAFATRALSGDAEIAPENLGSMIRSMQDPVSQLVLRLEVSRQYKQTVWEFDILWGSKVVRPELGARLIY